MRTKTILTILLISTFIGCSQFRDPRPPLMDNNSFTNFIPTVITNEMAITNNCITNSL